MQKNLTEFKCIVGEIESHFHFEANCPISVAKEAVFQCLKWIGQIEDAAKAQMNPENETIEEKTEEPND